MSQVRNLSRPLKSDAFEFSGSRVSPLNRTDAVGAALCEALSSARVVSDMIGILLEAMVTYVDHADWPDFKRARRARLKRGARGFEF